jgi:uncharacterized membrane protein YkvA (DUF1232 family)
MLRLLAIRSLIFPFLRLVWRLIRDRRVSVFTKIIPLLALIYLISPYDFVGDRIPVLGQFDDLIVITVLLLLFIAASPAHVVADLTIGKKLRDLQNRKNGDSEGKTVDTEIRYIDDEDDESDGDAKEEDEDGDSGKSRG